MKVLEFDEWYSEEYVKNHASETGEDKKPNFNLHEYAKDLYDHYLWDSLLNEDG